MPGFGDIAGFALDPFNAGTKVGQKVGADLAGKGAPKQEHLSAILARNGWGPGNGPLNREARGVVIAESSADPTKDNGTCCVGLFQMNRVHAGSYGIPSGAGPATEWLKDPDNNAASAYKLFVAVDRQWEPTWSAHTNQSYRAHVGQDPLVKVGDKPGINIDPVGAVKGAVGGVTSGIDGIASLLGALADPSFYARIGKGFLGGILIIVGVGALVFSVASTASRTPVGRATRKVVTKV